jgi:hypothetical protein
VTKKLDRAGYQVLTMKKTDSLWKDDRYHFSCVIRFIPKLKTS